MNQTIRTVALTVTLAVLAAVMVVTLHEPGPRYKGQSLGYWLGQLASNDVVAQEQARDAFRAMGTNAYPYLMLRLTALPPPRSNPIHELLRRLPFVRCASAGALAQPIAAMEALAIIAPPLAPRGPEFAQQITNSSPMPAHILVNMGDPALEPLASCLTNEGWQVRFDAAKTLTTCKCDISPVRAALLRALNDSHPGVARMAAKALGRGTSDNRLLISDLIMKSTSSDASLRANIIFSLGQLAQTDTNAIPALIFAMEDGNPLVRREATNALREIRNGVPFWVAKAVGK